MIEKVCQHCGEVFAAKLDRAKWCSKRCKTAAARQRYPEMFRDASRNWNKANPERARENKRRWFEANPEKARESINKWREANPEKRRASAIKTKRKRLRERSIAKIIATIQGGQDERRTNE